MRNLSTFLLLIVCFYGCSEDSFSKIVEFDIEDEDQKLVVISELITEVGDNHIVISKTTGVTSSSNRRFPYVVDADLQIVTPDVGNLQAEFVEVIDNTDPDNDVAGLYIIQDYTFLPSETYTLQVKHPDFEDLSSTITTTSRPDVEVIEFRNNRLSEYQTEEFYTIRINDNPDEENHYRFDLFQTTFENGKDTIRNRESIWFDSNELVEGDINLLSDVSFQNKSKTITLQAFDFITENTQIIKREVVVTSFNKELADYLQSVELLQQNENNPFVEPSILYTNIENGLGVFAIGISTVLEFEE